MAAAGLPRVSVVVATLNRCDYLRLCLEALARQTADSSGFEVVVVDNGSTDATQAFVRDLSARTPNLRYVREARLGLSVARNAGLRESRADIVAYTDDDAVPHPQWVERIIARFEALGQDVAILGGDVRPIWEAPRPDWLTDALLRPLSAGLLWGPAARMLVGDEWLMEVNIAYRKARLVEFGGFAEQLGRVGDTLLSSDGCVNLLMGRAGLRCYYDPQIVVGHHIHASRLTRAWFRRRHFWQGVSNCRVRAYLDQMSAALKLPETRLSPNSWEEVVVPASAAEWADLFDDRSRTPFENQLAALEQLGYLLQSQGLLSGR